MDGDPLQQAPVVLVVVTRHPRGGDLPEVLAAAAAQDHPNVRLVVMTDVESPELPALVGGVAPGAVVRHATDATWYGDLADQVLKLVQGDPAFYCFVRDGVALAPDALSAMVRESHRSNAGVAGPKLVAWDRPDRLVSVGVFVDKFGERAPIAQPGELDQEQHDAVRDVFALDGACMLVRGDLFRTLGGFDPGLTEVGEDLDLCWRAHVAGARVLVVPDAVARCRAPEVGPETDARRERNRFRTVLGAYTGSHLLRVVPQLAVVTVLQVLASLLGGRFRKAGALTGAWVDVVTGPGRIGAKRRALAPLRAVPDADVRRLQLRGSAALLRQIRRVNTEERGRFVGVRTAGRQVASGVRRAERSSLVALAVLVLTAVVGGRALLLHGVPVVGELVPLPASARGALRSYLSGWWTFGVGRSSPVPAGLGVVGALGLVVLGKLALLRTLLVVAPFVLGPWGAWRLVRPLRSRPARVAALLVYAGLPLGVNAAATGHLTGLLVWAATPWVVGRVARISGEAPFVARNGVLPAAAGLALLTAVVAALAPAFLLVPVLCALGLGLGGLVAGRVVGAVRALLVTLVATAVGALLLLPWPAALGGRPGFGFGRTTLEGPDRLSAWALLRFATGPHGRVGLGALVAGAALVAVVVARDERFGWAVRGIALSGLALTAAWLASRGSFGAHPPSPEVFLAPAATGLALAVAAGAAEFDLALRGARLSWRQPLLFVAGVAVVVASVPTLGAHLGGRFGLPGTDLVQTLRLLPPAPEGAGQRLLWVGRAGSLPGGGWPLAGGLSYELTDGDGPTLAGRWSERPVAAERELGQALLLAADGQTDRLGHLLGPAGVRFVLVDTVLQLPVAPAAAATDLSDPTQVDRAGADAVRQPATLLAALAGQLDLRLATFERDQRLVVYENVAWIPVRAQLPAAAASASRQAAAASLVQADLGGATPVLPATAEGATAGAGPVDVGTVYAGVPLDARWKLHTADATLSPEPAFGWASAYPVRTAGTARLEYDTSTLRALALLVQLAAWLVVAGVSLPRRAVADEAADDVLAPGPRSRSYGGTDWTDDEPMAAPDDRWPVEATVGAGPDDDLQWGDEGTSWAGEGDA